nr:MAG TPA: hypothetical protein [Caudoviricetes sp.]
MSKSALVIDTPENCIHCPLLNSADECTVQDDDANFNASDSWDELMKGCPLKPLPEKITTENDMTDYQCGMVDGRNQCINEITGGE